MIPEIPSLLTQAKVETTLRKDLNDLQIKHETEIKEQTKLLAESQAHNLQQQKYNEQMIAQVNFSKILTFTKLIIMRFYLRF